MLTFKNLYRSIYIAGLIGVALIMSGCSTPRPEPTAEPTATSTHTPAPIAKPGIALASAESGPGDRVDIAGSNWQPADTVFIYLQDPSILTAQPGNYGDIVATGEVAADGRFLTGFTFPIDSAWIDLPGIIVTAFSPSSGDVASAGLRVISPPSSPTPTATATSTPTATSLPPTPVPTARPTRTPIPITDWRGEYFGNRDLAASPVLVRNDVDINFDWGSGSPDISIPANDFSVRWTRQLSFPAGTYRFYVRVDDGVRLWLNGELLIDQWHDATEATYPAERTLSAGSYTIRVEYYESRGVAQARFWWERPGDFPQWRGEYFSNPDLSGAATVMRNDPEINFDWHGGAPANGMPIDNFSARWTRSVTFSEATYRFRARMDDGVRLYIDGALVLADWRDGGWREITADVKLSAGVHSLRVEYYDRGGNAAVQVGWEEGGTYPDWKGEYWANKDLSGAPVLVRNDAALDFNWGSSTPAQIIPPDNFSARWTRSANFDADRYRFRLTVDDGARLWLDDRLVIDEWRDGAEREVSADVDLTQGVHRLRVEYYERTSQARIRLSWAKVPTYTDWKGEYWANQDLSGSPALVRNDIEIHFDWGEGAPAPGLPVDGFSARWTRQSNFEAGPYRFYVQTDDGARVTVGGVLALDEWHDNFADGIYSFDLNLIAGRHPIVVEYYDRVGSALIKVWWERISSTPLQPAP